MKKCILVIALTSCLGVALAQETNKVTILIGADAPQQTATQSSSGPVTAGQTNRAIMPKPPLLSETLPGLGVLPGAEPTRTQAVRVGADRNESVFISLNQTNRISTPFENPLVVDSSGATIQTIGQEIFFLPSSAKPTTIYINGGPSQTVGLTLVPKAGLAAQSYVIQPEGRGNAKAGAAAVADVAPMPADYVGRINSIMRQLSLGRTPSGFTKAALPAATVQSDTVMVNIEHKYSGSHMDVFAYRVTSTSAAPIELKEEAFYTPSVRAVAFFPNTMLHKGDATLVFVIADRNGEGK